MKRSTFLIAVVAALFLAVGAYAQTTGSIEGTVTDENGAVLPGVTIEATSVNLQGTKVAVSDTGGKFRLVLLPPGTYTVKATLAGFATTESTGIEVSLGHTVTLAVQMHSAFKEEVVVSGAPPAIDVKSTELGTNLTAKQFENLPVGRNYSAMIQIAPGTATDATGATVYGSTGAENAYYIDGVNTSSVEYGQQGKNLNFEFIQEMQVKTGGYQAEFGRATGGLINVITKSGSNEFHGDVFGYLDDSSLQASLSKTVRDEAATLDRSFTQKSYKRQDYGLDVGGYMVKDKLWFFGAYDYLKNDANDQVASDFNRFASQYPAAAENYGFPAAGQVFPRDAKTDLYSGKLTYRASENHSLILSIFGDPAKTTGFVGPTLAGNANTITGSLEQGGTDGTLKYEGVLGAAWVIDAAVAQHKEKNIYGGTGFDSVALLDYTHPLYLLTGVLPIWDGWGYAFSNRFERDQYKADVSYFVNNWGGDHEFKFGVEQEHIKIDNTNYNSGGQRIYKFCEGGYNADLTCAGTYYYRHRFYMTQRPPGDAAFPGGDPFLVDNSYIANGLPVHAKNNNYAVYGQDTWKAMTNLTFDLGVRWERQEMYDKFGKVAADLKKNWAPRVGFVWDPRNDGTSKVFGSYGYFYETIPSDMIIRSFGSEIDGFLYNLHGAENDPNRYDVACDPTVYAFRHCSMPGAEATPVDPNLKGQYISEGILGSDFEVAKNWVVGGQFIYRNLERVIEDALAAGATSYFIGNPGEGIQKQDYDINYGGPYTVPKAKRRFVGFEVDVRKRFADNWQFIGSYLWSHLYGTYDGTFQASTGQLDPNINSAYDYYDFEVHNNGELSNDRRHQIKLYGSYTFPFGLNAGLAAYWYSGTPITAMGYSAAYQNWEFYLSSRGAFGTTPGVYDADLHLGYPIKVGGVQINILADVFNLTDRQGTTGVDLRYDLGEDYEVINYTADGSPGTIVPAIKKGDASTPPTNPAFGKPNAWQAPRSIRVGVRLTF
jgi:outer membrane receptor protein involved in Fe transport